ncbi:Zinc knuckle (CCHC-type) family protein isoform 1 [Rhynchospora pubera]|uniref:Zinc knuckle (CCHC-type) family protein isoform 1 n=1 Tax=Rhynchospora pubera TaxID=906938 RepID=A0AAV8FHJ7_9POAL|nr:Zinc knuckle (CCHC-type) family protein isoform 1 [Rhynchospora pubera]
MNQTHDNSKRAHIHLIERRRELPGSFNYFAIQLISERFGDSLIQSFIREVRERSEFKERFVNDSSERSESDTIRQRFVERAIKSARILKQIQRSEIEIQCYVCKREEHLCCTVAPDSSPKVVSCYNCAELGHTGAGCAKPRRENGTVVPPILCYKCGEEGHFARGCRITNKSIVRSVLGITPKSNKSKMKEREKKFGFRSAPEEKKGIKRKGHHDRRGSFSTTPKSRGKGGITDFRSDISSSSSPKKYKLKSWSPKERSYENYGHRRDYSTPYSSEKRHWQGYHQNQYKPRYTESRYSNSQTRFAQS